MRRNKIYSSLSILIFVFFVNSLFAQKYTSSPYSRFGLGQITNRTFAQSNAMGGSFVALKNDTLLPVFLNPANPASYSSLGITTFEAGVNSTFNQFSNTSFKTNSNNTALNYVSLGFPMGKSMGGCFGVMPLSSVGYNIYHTSKIENIGEVKENYEGDGGVNQIFFGTAWKPFSKSFVKYRNSKKYKSDDSASVTAARNKIFIKRWLSSLSVGANGYYYFGTINTISRVIFPDVNNTFNTRVNRQANINSFSGSLGMQSTFNIDSKRLSEIDTVTNSRNYGKHKRRNLKEDIYITLGYTYSMNNKLNATYSNFANTFLYFGAGNESFRDTIFYNADIKGKITLPTMHGIGVSIRKGSKWNIVADYEMQLWSGFKYFDDVNYLQDMKRVSIGAEFVPNKFAHGKGDYLKRVHYRLGARYNDGFLLINNNRVNDYALTAGFGFPVGANKLLNTFNVSVEAGQTGTTQNNLIKYQYIKATLGFTFNDRWFLKYKYD